MSILKRFVMTTMLGLSLAGGVLLGGCDKKITITQVPVFYTPQLKSIAVARFRNQTPVKGAGEIIADQVAAGLMANGTYKVYNRNDLKAVMDENDLQMALSDNPTAAANGLKKLTQVQAILVGTVTTYSATTTSQQRQEPVYAYTKKGKAYITGYRTVVDRRNEGNVVVTATLIRVSDGSTIYATPQPISYTAWAEGKGTPPKMDPHACLAKAATHDRRRDREHLRPEPTADQDRQGQGPSNRHGALRQQVDLRGHLRRQRREDVCRGLAAGKLRPQPLPHCHRPQGRASGPGHSGRRLEPRTCGIRIHLQPEGHRSQGRRGRRV